MFNRLARLILTLLVIALTTRCNTSPDVDEPSSRLVTQPTSRQAILLPTISVPPTPANPQPTLIPTVSATTLPESTTLSPGLAQPTDILSGGMVQTVVRSWSTEELLDRKAKAGVPIWADGNQLTFVYQGQADEVRVCCGI